MRCNRLVAHMVAAVLLMAFSTTARAGNLSDALAHLESPLNTLKPEQFKKLIPGREVYSASVPLFGKTTTVYLYWQKSGARVIAAVLPDVLTADKLFHVGSGLDVGLSKPVLFQVGSDDMLYKNEMPRDLIDRAREIGMPEVVNVSAGFNLFGRLASGFVGGMLKHAPVNLDPQGLFTGIAKGKGGYTVSLSVAAGTIWQKPFMLEDTTVKGATLRITSDKGDKTVEAWGTASLGKSAKKDITIYARRDTASQSLGFDAKDASLEDFFLIVGIAGKSLKLPRIPTPGKLPLRMVTISNPHYAPYKDASSPPHFDSMMFKGTLAGTKSDGELITHAKGKIFNLPVAMVNLAASSSGVTGDAEIAAKLGPLQAQSAKF